MCNKHNFISGVARRTKPKKKLNVFKQLEDRLPEFILDNKTLANKYGVCINTIIRWQEIFQIGKNNNG